MLPYRAQDSVLETLGLPWKSVPCTPDNAPPYDCAKNLTTDNQATGDSVKSACSPASVVSSSAHTSR